MPRRPAAGQETAALPAPASSADHIGMRMPGTPQQLPVLSPPTSFPGQPALTASGCLHLYFTVPAGMAAYSANGAWPRIDIRGPGYRLGGYVARPGSVVGGRPYDLAGRSLMAELPGWVADALTWLQAARSPRHPQREISVPFVARSAADWTTTKRRLTR